MKVVRRNNGNEHKRNCIDNVNSWLRNQLIFEVILRSLIWLSQCRLIWCFYLYEYVFLLYHQMLYGFALIWFIKADFIKLILKKQSFKNNYEIMGGLKKKYPNNAWVVQKKCCKIYFWLIHHQITLTCCN